MDPGKQRSAYTVTRSFFLVGLASTVLASAACESTADTFSADGQLAGNALHVDPNGSCRFHDFTFSTEEPATLRGADNAILATDQLKIGPSMYASVHDDANGKDTGGVCSLSFHFDKVKSGEAGYQLTVGSAGPIVVTEHQLRSKDFEIRPREVVVLGMNNQVILGGPEAPLITVQPKS